MNGSNSASSASASSGASASGPTTHPTVKSDFIKLGRHILLNILWCLDITRPKDRLAMHVIFGKTAPGLARDPSEVYRQWMQKSKRRTVYDGPFVYKFVNDRLHCEDGPAVKTAWGNERWFMCHQPHRLYGPAAVYHPRAGPGVVNRTSSSTLLLTKDMSIDIELTEGKYHQEKDLRTRKRHVQLQAEWWIRGKPVHPGYPFNIDRPGSVSALDLGEVSELRPFYPNVAFGDRSRELKFAMDIADVKMQLDNSSTKEHMRVALSKKRPADNDDDCGIYESGRPAKKHHVYTDVTTSLFVFNGHIRVLGPLDRSCSAKAWEDKLRIALEPLMTEFLTLFTSAHYDDFVRRIQDDEKDDSFYAFLEGMAADFVAAADGTDSDPNRAYEYRVFEQCIDVTVGALSGTYDGFIPPLTIAHYLIEVLGLDIDTQKVAAAAGVKVDADGDVVMK